MREAGQRGTLQRGNVASPIPTRLIIHRDDVRPEYSPGGPE